MRGFMKGVVAAAAMACCGNVVCAQTAVGNAGFEDDILYDVAPAVGNWTAFFGGPPSSVLAAIRDTTAPRSGASALLISVAGDGNAFAGVQQPSNGLQPGVSYTMKIWARRAGPVTNGVEFRFEWKDSNGGFIGDQFGLNTPIQASLTDEYQQFVLTAVAPAGAAGANLVMAAQSFTFNPVMPEFNTSVYIDDVEFGATPLPTQAACCLADGSCQVALLDACPSGATQQAPGTTCAPNNCPPPAQPGACCNRSSTTCTVTLAAICTPVGGNYLGDGTTCSPNPCPAPCPADFNGSGNLTVQDIFDFLSAYFVGC
ncbi:MAG: hypothetical protein ACK4WH_11485 [Phycisphaerales bacterium]